MVIMAWIWGTALRVGKMREGREGKGRGWVGQVSMYAEHGPRSV